MELSKAPTDQDLHLASLTFRKFSKLPGAQHIATKFALSHLSRLLFEIQPKRVLEMGAGIGTSTHLLLQHSVGIEKIVSTEDNEFCLQALKDNIPPPTDSGH